MTLFPSRLEVSRGMTRTDSMAFDLHKWIYLPIEIGCVLVRSETAHRKSFTMAADPLDHGGSAA